MRLWTSETIGALGRQITGLAMPTVAILLLSAGPFEMGVLNGLQLLAFPVLGLFVGVWADRWRRRPIMVAANVGRMLAVGSIPLAFLFGVLRMYQLYIVAAVTGAFTVFFDIAYQSYLPTLIDRSDLIEGNSKLEASQSAAQVAGQPFAGFLIQLAGAAQSIVIDAAAFLTSAILIFSIRKHESRIDSKKERHFLNELKEGAAVVFRNPILRNIAACTATMNLGSSIFFVVFLLFAYDTLRLSPGIVGLVLGIGSAGYVLGAICSARVGKILGLGPTLAVSAILSGIGLVAIPLAQRGPPAPILTILWFVSSVGIPIYNINQVSLRQAITSDDLQGRMNATMRTLVWGTVPVGSFAGGILGSVFGVLSTLYIGAVVSILGAVFVLSGPVRSLREIPKMETQTEALAWFCRYCGRRIDSSSKYCCYCGRRLE